MIPFIIATVFSCEDATRLISKMQTYRVSEEARSEMIQIVKDGVTEPGCWDGND